MTKHPYLVFLSLALIFIPLERLFSNRKSQRLIRKGILTDLCYFLSNKYLNQIGQIILITLVVPAFHYLSKTGSTPPSKTELPLWLETLSVMLLADFLVYWAHRLTHKLPFLWKFHAIHHSTTNLDWLAAFRLHFLDQIFTKAISMIPIFLLGFSSTAIEINILFTTLHAAFNHSNLRIRLPFIRYFICTPEFHNWHHSTDPRYAQKHFAGSFAFFDYLFGSGMPLNGSSPTEVGLRTPVPETFLEQLKFPFREWAISLKKWKAPRTTLSELQQNESQ